MEADPDRRVSAVRREAKEQLPVDLAVTLVEEKLNRRLRRARKIPSYMKFDRPPMSECEVPENLKQTRRKTPFLLHDSKLTEPGEWEVKDVESLL